MVRPPECNEEHDIMPGASQGCGAVVGEEGSFEGSIPRSASDCGNYRVLQEWGRDSCGGFRLCRGGLSSPCVWKYSLSNALICTMRAN